jgi:ribonuclease HII
MIPPSLRYERNLLKKGFGYVAGVDEVGRGPLAGPVVAAAVILPPDKKIKGIKDSKQLPQALREELYHKIFAHSIGVSIGVVSERIIDEINILNATYLAMRDAISRLPVCPDHVLVDGKGRIRSLDTIQTSITSGDDISTSIAAASIIAKVTRDRIMDRLEVIYPGYNFAGHKGYGTEEHLRILKKKGPSPIHRRSFEPVSELFRNSRKY